MLREQPKTWPKMRIERTNCPHSCSKCDESWDLLATAEDGHEFCAGTIRAGNDDSENRGIAARIAELWNEHGPQGCVRPDPETEQEA